MATIGSRVIVKQAPILTVPAILDSRTCLRIIDAWMAHNEESYTMVEKKDGILQRVYDSAVKTRRDHFLDDAELLDIFTRCVAESVCPRLWEAYRFEATRFEDPRVGCYDAEAGGRFGPHRDDSALGTAHRLFGISINLNAGEYEGGYLKFPEYSTDLYHAETGGAVVFSGAMLHEVTQVTQGRRFVLVSFLYGERESVSRKEYYRRILLQDRAPDGGRGGERSSEQHGEWGRPP
jgi:predicted 2-oxoglutarate/Fe(II)-dependent dioxygenase YbiX